MDSFFYPALVVLLDKQTPVAVIDALTSQEY